MSVEGRDLNRFSGPEKLQTLRSRHPRLVYRSFSIETCPAGVTRVEHNFLLEPDIEFRTELSIHLPERFRSRISADSLRSYAFSIGLVEAISFWKCACPAEFVVEAGQLNGRQTEWWRHLFIHGLGEFFFQNEIDFTADDFLQIESSNDAERIPKPEHREAEGSLLLLAGGKDSLVSLELLVGQKPTVLMLNPTKAAERTFAPFAERLGEPVILRRTIDPQLLALNQNGYLNGHTPFSAYLAFSSSLAAYLAGRRYVIASNESSASEGNARYCGMEVNHQYSKSLDFENRFGVYAKEHLSGSVEYFSLLRPLEELQIAGLFSEFPQHFNAFLSCNRGARENRWCGGCPKCAFVYLILSVFLERQELSRIFGADLLERGEIRQEIRGLVGLTDAKPFECVGTHAESKAAFLRLSTDNLSAAATVFVESTRQALEGQTASGSIDLRKLSDEHRVPEAFFRILRTAVDRSKALGRAL